MLAAIHTLNRLEGVGETICHALNTLAVVFLDWLLGYAQRGCRQDGGTHTAMATESADGDLNDPKSVVGCTVRVWTYVRAAAGQQERTVWRWSL